MAKIELAEPNGPYRATINTEVMQVRLTEVFLGVGFATEDGESLAVSMRDSGYELIYRVPGRPDVHVSLQGGLVSSEPTPSATLPQADTDK